ncbi:MAG: WD40 repeat domain-containing protein [Roseofilum sp. SID2]|uniref:WD40 domain-containing protein n=1 Tax=unclassified Roseofilum TaxID=2620099 RepID=UPI001B07E1A8|nr:MULTISPECIES: hypothetical protein [unclassified Roseofilum]MBP0013341.1 WD40 repeat domain-containing protein [Roseofilum sp. SID3]MBP0024886.1 WD40 repeat domain-containing protein [Roseofilum sp. SID2]MBP0036871.1 WD40 repeat domain-containing protein [Roseofilum sp. SID1]
MQDTPELENERSLKTLARTLKLRRGKFTLIQASCNSVSLRTQLLHRLIQEYQVNTLSITLPQHATGFHTAVLKAIEGQSPDALMILGLESVSSISELLISANQKRDQIRQSFVFPIVLWVTDGILRHLGRLASDINSWNPPPIRFTISDADILKFLSEESHTLFDSLHYPTSYCSSSIHHLDLDLLSKEIQRIYPKLTLELQAKFEFMLAQLQCSKAQFDRAIDTLCKSLKSWHQLSNIRAQGFVLFNLGLVYLEKSKVKESKEKGSNHQLSQEYFHQALDCFKTVNQPDLMGVVLSYLQTILQNSENWENLKSITEKALSIHQFYGSSLQLAQDYGYLAQVALENHYWKETKLLAQQAIQRLESNPNPGDTLKNELSRFYFLRAKAEIQLQEFQGAITRLEEARKNCIPKSSTQLYSEILEESIKLYWQDKNYLKSFSFKIEKRSIEAQYGLRSFMGVGRFPKPKRITHLDITSHNTKTTREIVSASGRQEDIDNLLTRMERRDRKLTVIYGPSGVGKSSLLQAGLVTALKLSSFEGNNYFPILIQVYHHWQEDFSLQIRAISPTCSAILQRLEEMTQHYQIPVLLFDQLEEFFLHYSDRNKRQEFYDFIQACLRISYVKMVLSIREDYLYYLLELTRYTDLGELDKNYEDILYYLGNFSPPEAKAIIEYLTNRSSTPLEPSLIDRLVEDLTTEQEEIRPIELQLIGAQLENQGIITLRDYQRLGSNPKEVLIDIYLDEVVRDCGPEQEAIAELVLYLLTDDDNTRPLKTQASLEKALEQKGDRLNLVLEIFVKSGLVLHLSGELDNHYQLVHDYLVPFIRHKKGAQLLADLEQERQQRQKSDRRFLLGMRTATIISLILTGLAMLFAGTANYQQQQAFKQRQIAENNAISALEQSIIAQSTTARTLMRSTSGQQLEALVTALEAAAQLRQHPRLKSGNVTHHVINSLANAIYNLKEFNRLETQSIIYHVNFSPNGQFIATAQNNGAVKIWQQDGTLLTTLKGHQDRVYWVSFSPDGKWMASASIDRTIKLWDLANFSAIKTFHGHQDRIYNVTFSLNSQFIASSSRDGTVKLWNLEGKTLLTYRRHRDSVESISFSPDGQLLASASNDRTVKVWTITGKHRLTYRGHQSAVTFVQFSPDGKFLASADANGLIKLWNLHGQEIATLKGHRDTVLGLSFSPDDQILASGSRDKNIIIWNMKGEVISTISGHNDWVNSVMFSPDSQTLASASADGMVKLWKLQGSDSRIFKGHQDKVYTAQFTPDLQSIISSSADGSIRLWSVQEGKELATLVQEQERIYGLDVSPDGQRIVYGSRDGTVRWRSLHDSTTRTFRGHQEMVLDVDFSPDGQTIASASLDRTVKLWDLNGKNIATFSGHSEGVQAVHFSPNGQLIASAGNENLIKIWTLDGSELATFRGHKSTIFSVSFSPDGNLLASGSRDKTVKLWKLDGTLVNTFENHTAPVISVSFSPDGQMIASASDDKTVKISRLNGEEIMTLEGHTDWLNEVSFSPDGQWIASASHDGTVRLWRFNYDLDYWFDRGCAWLKDYLHHQHSRSAALCENP